MNSCNPGTVSELHSNLLGIKYNSIMGNSEQIPSLENQTNFKISCFKKPASAKFQLNVKQCAKQLQYEPLTKNTLFPSL